MRAPILLIDLEPDRESAERPPVPGSAIDVLARTLWGEAHAEPVRAKEALAALVMNRVARAQRAGGRYWWGASVVEVCRRPWQFACWNDGDAARCARVTVEDRRFRICLRIARRAVAGTLADPTGGATHCHPGDVLPPWARDRTPSAEICGLVFYNDVE